MELFIKIMFILTLVGIITRILCIGFVEYPRETKKGADIVQLFFSIGIAIWMAILLY